MRGRLRRLYPRVSEVYILDALNHIKNSEVLTGNPDKAEAMTDEELKTYYEEMDNIHKQLNKKGIFRRLLDFLL